MQYLSDHPSNAKSNACDSSYLSAKRWLKSSATV